MANRRLEEHERTCLDCDGDNYCAEAQAIIVETSPVFAEQRRALAGFVADVHVGNHARLGGPIAAGLNDRCRLVIRVLQNAVNLALKAGCKTFCVLGDLFDTTRPEPQVIAALLKVLASAERGGMTVLLLMGNHDQVSTAPGDHALGPLSPYGIVVETPGRYALAGDTELALIPFQPGRAEKWLPPAVDELMRAKEVAPNTILGIHAGIITEDTPPYLRGCDDAVSIELLDELKERHGFKAILAGNWHLRQTWPAYPGIMQVGALVPTGWDNPGLKGYGTLAMWGGRGLSHIEIVGPRFVKLTGLDEDAEPLLKPGANPNVYLRLEVGKDELATAAGRVAAAKLAGAEVLPYKADAQAAARTAATVARASLTLGEALAGYIQQMDLDDHVARPTVLARSRAYLGM